MVQNRQGGAGRREVCRWAQPLQHHREIGFCPLSSVNVYTRGQETGWSVVGHLGGYQCGVQVLEYLNTITQTGIMKCHHYALTYSPNLSATIPPMKLRHKGMCCVQGGVMDQKGWEGKGEWRALGKPPTCRWASSILAGPRWGEEKGWELPKRGKDPVCALVASWNSSHCRCTPFLSPSSFIPGPPPPCQPPYLTGSSKHGRILWWNYIAAALWQHGQNGRRQSTVGFIGSHFMTTEVTAAVIKGSGRQPNPGKDWAVDLSLIYGIVPAVSYCRRFYRGKLRFEMHWPKFGTEHISQSTLKVRQRLVWCITESHTMFPAALRLYRREQWEDSINIFLEEKQWEFHFLFLWEHASSRWHFQEGMEWTAWQMNKRDAAIPSCNPELMNAGAGCSPESQLHTGFCSRPQQMQLCAWSI